jgi:MFS family permease
MIHQHKLKSNDTPQWQQLIGLTVLQGAITLTWIIYNAYLVQLLARFGFPAIWGIYLLIIENLVSVLVEPLMGTLSDRSQQSHLRHPNSLTPQWFVGRFPFITIGILLTAIFFFAIPLVATGMNPLTVGSWVLPGVMILWALCMSVFQTPAMALIGRYVSETRLPQAISLLMMGGTVIRAFGAAATQLILSLGPMAAFTSGSVTVLVAGALLYRFHLNAPANPNSIAATAQDPRSLSLFRLAQTFLVGCGIALTGRSMGVILAGKMVLPNLSLLLVWLLTQAIVLIPAGFLMSKLGYKKPMTICLAILAIVLLNFTRQSDASVMLGLTIMSAIVYSFIINGTFPFALDRVPDKNAGLGISMYFCGGAFAAVLFGLATNYAGKLNPEQAALLGVGGMLLAIVGLLPMARKQR